MNNTLLTAIVCALSFAGQGKADGDLINLPNGAPLWQCQCFEGKTSNRGVYGAFLKSMNRNPTLELAQEAALKSCRSASEGRHANMAQCLQLYQGAGE